jgi:hypothetical protein
MESVNKVSIIKYNAEKLKSSQMSHCGLVRATDLLVNHLTLQMEELSSSKMSVNHLAINMSNIPADLYLHQLH